MIDEALQQVDVVPLAQPDDHLRHVLVCLGLGLVNLHLNWSRKRTKRLLWLPHHCFAGLQKQPRISNGLGSKSQRDHTRSRALPARASLSGLVSEQHTRCWADHSAPTLSAIFYSAQHFCRKLGPVFMVSRALGGAGACLGSSVHGTQHAADARRMFEVPACHLGQCRPF